MGDSSQHSGADAERALAQAERMYSRDGVIECPHFMAVLGYLARQYGIPRYVWKPEGLRYHYTDAAGLLGMVKTNRIWATDVSFLNDPSEGKLFPKAIIRQMEEKPGGLNELEARIVQSIKANDTRRDGVLPYSVSFCAEGDLLSQWRGYGSFGSGYAIGFELAGVPHWQIGQLVEVIYGMGDLGALALDLLSIYCEAAGAWRGSTFDGLCGDAAGALSALGLAFKDASYADERETRILASAHHRGTDLFTDEAPLRFRSRGSDIVPYVDLSMGLIRKPGGAPPCLPIRRIVTGPGVDYARNKGALEQVLAIHGYSDIEIIHSDIPFRR